MSPSPSRDEKAPIVSCSLDNSNVLEEQMRSLAEEFTQALEQGRDLQYNTALLDKLKQIAVPSEIRSSIFESVLELGASLDRRRPKALIFTAEYLELAKALLDGATHSKDTDPRESLQDPNRAYSNLNLMLSEAERVSFSEEASEKIARNWFEIGRTALALKTRIRSFTVHEEANSDEGPLSNSSMPSQHRGKK